MRASPCAWPPAGVSSAWSMHPHLLMAHLAARSSCKQGCTRKGRWFPLCLAPVLVSLWAPVFSLHWTYKITCLKSPTGLQTALWHGQRLIRLHFSYRYSANECRMCHYPNRHTQGKAALSVSSGTHKPCLFRNTQSPFHSGCRELPTELCFAESGREFWVLS